MRVSESAELEQAILGGILVDCGDLPPGLDLVTVDDFVVGTHRKIFCAVRNLSEKREPIDTITVSESLKGISPEPKQGWFSYLTQLSLDAPTSANVDHWAEKLRAASRRRDFIEVMSEALDQAKDPQVDGDDLMATAVVKIGKLSDRRSATRPVALSDAIRDEYKAIETRGLGEVVGQPTGFASIDEITGGLPLGGLVVVAARPAMGKSAYATNMLTNICVKQQKSGLIFSLEMGRQELAQRMLASEARIDLRRIRTGKLLDSDHPKLANASNQLWTDRLAIVDKAGLSITELRTIARQYAARHTVDVIVVDYLQLMEGKGENREQQVAAISRGLKALAMELHIPVVALSQLNRGLESRQDKRPMLSDLRESGAIEQDADQVHFIYRDEYYKRDSKDKGIAEIIIGKNRNGPPGMRKLRWFGEFTRFVPFGETLQSDRPVSEYEYEQ